MIPSLRAQRSNPALPGPKPGLQRRDAPRKDEVKARPRHCERSEATQPSPARSLGCRVATLLAMTRLKRDPVIASAAKQPSPPRPEVWGCRVATLLAVTRSSAIPSLRAQRSNPARPGPKSGLPRRDAPRNDEVKARSRHCERSEATQPDPARSLGCLRRDAPRNDEVEARSRHCERSEATQPDPARSLGCCVATLLARTRLKRDPVIASAAKQPSPTRPEVWVAAW